MRAVAAHGVIPVRPTRQRPAVQREPPRVHGLGGRPLRRLGFDPALGEQPRVQRIADRPVDVPYVPLADVWDHVVRGVVPLVLHHGWLDGMLDAGEPFLQRVSHLVASRPDSTALLVVGHRVPACFPRLAFGRNCPDWILTSGRWAIARSPTPLLRRTRRRAVEAVCWVSPVLSRCTPRSRSTCQRTIRRSHRPNSLPRSRKLQHTAQYA
jgi:hypothetical protein